MNSLVFIVEDERHIKNLLAKYLEREGISFIEASNLDDAVELFKHNEELITYIALDGNLGSVERNNPETLVLAKMIARSHKFKGKVLAMSSTPDCNKTLKHAIGTRCEIFDDSTMFIKIHVIKEIVHRIKEKRKAAQS